MAGVSFKITRNDISPKLAVLAGEARNPKNVLRAMGTTFMSITMGNFNDVGADYRPTVWAAKKADGRPSKLQQSGTMSRAFHLEVADKFAKVSNPVIYAATHQFGRDFGRGAPIPARPFFPVVNGKLTSKAEEKIGKAGERALNKDIGER
jgi:phage gpG-like protein